MVTLRPRASRMAPREAEAMPFPNEETTPPVTNTNWVIWNSRCGAGTALRNREDRLPESAGLKKHRTLNRGYFGFLAHRPLRYTACSAPAPQPVQPHVLCGVRGHAAHPAPLADSGRTEPFASCSGFGPGQPSGCPFTASQ